MSSVKLGRASLILVVIAACTDTTGLTGTGDELPTSDGGTKTKDSGGLPDPGDGGDPNAGKRCDVTKAFAPPELVTEFDAQSDFVKGAILSKNEREVFFLRYDTMASEWILRRATRASSDVAFAPATDIAVMPTPDGFLSLTAGGLKLYFWTTTNIYKTTRASVDATFGTPSTWDVPGGPAPFVVDSDDVAYFSRFEGDATLVRRILRGRITGTGFGSVISYVPNIWVDGAQDQNPILNASETALYFSSTRAGTIGLADIWVAHRPTKADEFGAAIHVRELSTDAPDTLTWISDDECVAYLDRASHVYVAKRPL